MYRGVCSGPLTRLPSDLRRLKIGGGKYVRVEVFLLGGTVDV